MQVIKEKENLVRDMVDRKRCIVIYGLQDKKNPSKYEKEKGEISSKESHTKGSRSVKRP